jgi:hypothetical protein
MSFVGLIWFSSAALAAVALMLSVATWVPAPWHPELVWPGGLGAAAALAALLATHFGRLPPGHWVRRPSPVWAGIATALVAIVVLGFLIG